MVFEIIYHHLFESESDMMGTVLDKVLVLKILLSSNHFDLLGFSLGLG